MLLMLTMACLADIRPDGLTDDVERGEALLQAAAEAQGLAAYEGVQSSVAVMRDVWASPYGFFSPWPDADPRFRITSLHHSFDTRVDFLDGEKAGWAWGISDWQTWEAPPGGAPAWADNGDARFMLPTMHYFLELPFRMLEAPVVRYAGVERVGELDYERVLATWESVEPNAKFDQYLLYINPVTGRIDKAYYTVREMGGFFTGTMHYEDQREVDGVWFSFDMVVTPEPTDELEGYLHRVTVESLSLEPVDPGLFLR